jgi:hypothetical protein
MEEKGFDITDYVFEMLLPSDTPVMCMHLEKWIGSLSRAMHSSPTIKKLLFLSVPHTSRSKYFIMQVDNCPLLHYLNALWDGRD